MDKHDTKFKPQIFQSKGRGESRQNYSDYQNRNRSYSRDGNTSYRDRGNSGRNFRQNYTGRLHDNYRNDYRQDNYRRDYRRDNDREQGYRNRVAVEITAGIPIERENSREDYLHGRN